MVGTWSSFSLSQNILKSVVVAVNQELGSSDIEILYFKMASLV